MTPPANRTASSVRNAAVSVFAQMVQLALGLVVRAIFVYRLGVELVGIDLLFLSVLSIVGLADLGLAAAVMYAMYQPLRDGDRDRLASLVLFSKSMYRIVALAVIVLGLLVAPLLPLVANTKRPMPLLPLYFLILIFGVAMNYLFMHRTTLLIADQRLYVMKLHGVVFQSGRQIVQLFMLLILPSYVAYVMIFVVINFANAWFVHHRVGILYPYLTGYAANVSSADRADLFKSVRALILYRMSGVVLNNVAPIFVVGMFGATLGGLYGNYMLFVGAVMTLLDALFSAITASVGNLVATTAERARLVFDELLLVAAIIYAVPAAIMAATLNEVITLWIGREYLLATTQVWAMACAFLVYGLTSPVLLFRQGTGLFRDAKYVMVLTAVISLILVWLLGSLFGLSGVILAAPVARLMVSFWLEPLMLFRRYIGGSFSRYGLQVAGVFSATIAGVFFSEFFLRLRELSALSAVVVGALSSLSGVLFLLFLCYRRTPEAAALQGRLRSVIGS